MADLLRDLADQLDLGEPSGASKRPGRNIAVDDGDVEDPEGNEYLPPLQAKLELLKRAEGLPNTYGEKDEECEDDYENQMSVVKRNAGMSKNARHNLADEDGPFEG